MALTWTLSSSPSGTRIRSGGSSIIIRRPSTILVSLERACRLSRPRAFRTFLAIFFVVFFLDFASESRPRTSCSPTREYQTSSSHLRELGHPLPVRGHGRLRGLATIRRVEAVVTAGHHEARGEAFDVPLPGSRQGLVEIVEIEEQGALRGGVRPKVQEVSIAAKLSLDAGLRGASEVVGHDDGRPAHECEQRSHHARVPDRYEVRDPVPGLCLQEVDRARPILCRRPRRMACPGDHPTGSAPTFVPLLVTRGRLRRPVGIGCYAGPRSARREVRVSLDFHGFSLTTSGPHAPWSWAARLASRRTV